MFNNNNAQRGANPGTFKCFLGLVCTGKSRIVEMYPDHLIDLDAYYSTFFPKQQPDIRSEASSLALLAGSLLGYGHVVMNYHPQFEYIVQDSRDFPFACLDRRFAEVFIPNEEQHYTMMMEAGLSDHAVAGIEQQRAWLKKFAHIHSFRIFDNLAERVEQLINSNRLDHQATQEEGRSRILSTLEDMAGNNPKKGEIDKDAGDDAPLNTPLVQTELLKPPPQVADDSTDDDEEDDDGSST